jgi:DNA modification methylase
MDDVTLYCGECAEVMAREIPDGSIDLTVTSPPYDNLRTYKGYTFDFEAIAAQLWRVTKSGGVVVWVVSDATINGSETGTSFRQALHFMGLGFNLHDTMIYKANRPPLNGPRYEQVFEYMFVLSKGTPNTVHLLREKTLAPGARALGGMRGKDGQMQDRTYCNRTGNEKTRENIWYAPRSPHSDGGKERHGHPATFPEALARDHIASWSNPGDLVLDPMMGSGTTGKEAIKAGRRFVGIDIAAEYVELARERIGQAQLQPALFAPAAPQAPAQGDLFAE